MRGPLSVGAGLPRSGRVGLATVRRILGYLACAYVLFALIGKYVESMGAVQCECANECWCHRPGLSLFRWVFPWGHRAPQLGGSAGSD